MVLWCLFQEWRSCFWFTKLFITILHAPPFVSKGYVTPWLPCVNTWPLWLSCREHVLWWPCSDHLLHPAPVSPPTFPIWKLLPLTMKATSSSLQGWHIELCLRGRKPMCTNKKTCFNWLHASPPCFGPAVSLLLPLAETETLFVPEQFLLCHSNVSIR